MGMAKYDRLLFILNSLRSRKNLTAKDLAEQCSVTERSIYRDIIALSEANVPIYYDRGYKLASDNFLPPLNFDFDEYSCLKIAVDSTPLAKTEQYGSLLRRIRAKIDAAVSDTVRKRRRFTPQTTHIDIAVTHSGEAEESFYQLLEKAITECCCIELEYLSIQSGESRRIVEPYFVIFRGHAFYFVAFCRSKEEVRTFRLDRIKSLKILKETFNRRDDITPKSYFKGSWEVFSGEPVKVVLKLTGAAARVVLSGQHHASEQKEQHADGSIRYTVTVQGLEEIQRWILGFGNDAEVLSPPELRESLAEIGKYLDQTYGEK
jgi:predicted DNA-binding transcriptional regulator YafY